MIDTVEFINVCEINYLETHGKSLTTIAIDSNSITVLPNPFEDDIYIIFGNPSKSVCYATILDITGKTILSFEIPKKTTTYHIPAERMANGVYYLKIWNISQTLKSYKIVKY